MEGWKETLPLMETLLDLFANPEGNINEVWSAHGWNLTFGRLLNDWRLKGWLTC